MAKHAAWNFQTLRCMDWWHLITSSNQGLTTLINCILWNVVSLSHSLSVLTNFPDDGPQNIFALSIPKFIRLPYGKVLHILRMIRLSPLIRIISIFLSWLFKQQHLLFLKAQSKYNNDNVLRMKCSAGMTPLILSQNFIQDHFSVDFRNELSKSFANTLSSLNTFILVGNWMKSIGKTCSGNMNS